MSNLETATGNLGTGNGWWALLERVIGPESESEEGEVELEQEQELEEAMRSRDS